MKQSTKDGGSAFPSHGSMGEVEHRGMSLRDWFSGQAMPNLLYLCREDTVLEGQSYVQHVARLAFNIANAMLAEREAWRDAQ